MWFWRGTQSAIFYYATCSPCMEYNHKHKRRKEARAVAKERAALDLSQPDMIRQPMAFTTNRYWAEEIEAGPGPPKGRRRDSLAGDLAQDSGKNSGSVNVNEKGKAKSVFANNSNNNNSNTVTFSEPVPGESSPPEPAKDPTRTHRPSMDQKQSTFDTLKETIRSSLSPETWNWKRYEREDEPLWGLNDAMSRMWERARPSHNRSNSGNDPSDRRRSFSHGRRRADTTDSDRYVYDYSRARHPEVNDLHPPVVSQLPATNAEVAWMLQPPPSRAVMEGKIRPGAEDMSRRRPLAAIGTSTEEERRRAWATKDRRGSTERIEKTVDREKRRPPPMVVSSEPELAGDEEDSGVDEDEDEERDKEASSPTDLRPARSASLPHIDRIQPLSKTANLSSERSPQLLQRPHLAVIASTKTTGAIRTITVPASSSRLNSRSSSPTSTYFTPAGRKVLSDSTNLSVPPEWEYLLKLCLPQIPPRTRSSLPSNMCL
jgi:hypothetical protein